MRIGLCGKRKILDYVIRVENNICFGGDKMSNDELLLAISDMLDKKINPLEKRMDSMEKELKSDLK